MNLWLRRALVIAACLVAVEAVIIPFLLVMVTGR